MTISENIQWITNEPSLWRFYTNRSYRAKIQISDSKQIYNVPGKPGIVYNSLEDAYEKVCDGGYVVTGIAGEMWAIGNGEKALKKYNVIPSDITAKPLEVNTIELDTVYAAIKISIETQFTLEVNYGEAAVLRGNRPGIDHGECDNVLVAAKLVNGEYQPDFDDIGRIINGAIFDRLYQPL